MRRSNTFGIQFVIRLSKQKKTDPATVFARISVNGRRCEISLKKKVNPLSWDEVKGKARGTKDEIRKLNEHLERVRTLIADGKVYCQDDDRDGDCGCTCHRYSHRLMA